MVVAPVVVSGLRIVDVVVGSRSCCSTVVVAVVVVVWWVDGWLSSDSCSERPLLGIELA